MLAASLNSSATQGPSSALSKGRHEIAQKRSMSISSADDAVRVCPHGSLHVMSHSDFFVHFQAAEMSETSSGVRPTMEHCMSHRTHSFSYTSRPPRCPRPRLGSVLPW